MDEINVDEIIDAILEKQDSCTMVEVYNASTKYREKHPGIYVDASGDTVDYYVYTYRDKYFWDSKAELIRKQEIFICPLCDTPHRKYPDTEKFFKLKALANGKGR